MTEALKLCKDCRHIRPNTMCGRAELDRGLSPVDGTPLKRHCEVAREFDHLCGPSGEYFTPKTGGSDV